MMKRLSKCLFVASQTSASDATLETSFDVRSFKVGLQLKSIFFAEKISIYSLFFNGLTWAVICSKLYKKNSPNSKQLQGTIIVFLSGSVPCGQKLFDHRFQL